MPPNIKSSDRGRELQRKSVIANSLNVRTDHAAARIMRVAMAGKLTPEEKASRAGELCRLYGVDSAKATRLVCVLLAALDKAMNRGDPESVRLVLGLIGQQISTAPAEADSTIGSNPAVLVPGGVVASDVLKKARALEDQLKEGSADNATETSG